MESMPEHNTSSGSGRFRLVELPQRTDARGSLGFAEEGAHVPFPVRRFFYLYALAPGAKRAGHAHRLQEQFLVMLHGACSVVIDDGRTRTELILSSPAVALYAPPLNWLELRDFSDNAVCAVLASGKFDQSDYIRDYGQFRELVAALRAAR